MQKEIQEKMEVLEAEKNKAIEREYQLRELQAQKDEVRFLTRKKNLGFLSLMILRLQLDIMEEKYKERYDLLQQQIADSGLDRYCLLAQL